ncbi:hypothetical protein ACFWNK_12770 [Streptomyces sp. NPDC058417]|uniref:hypothetical protein n=1 Tax=unclassified Streptomyces TaxID=2593676 RepID=UPI003662AD9C
MGRCGGGWLFDALDGPLLGGPQAGRGAYDEAARRLIDRYHHSTRPQSAPAMENTEDQIRP